MMKNKNQSNIDFKVMSFFFKIRDKFKSPMKKVEKAGIRMGNFVLDYGCGPGSYTIAAAKKVGPNGKVYAADIHPLAIKKVEQKGKQIGLTNIETILTDCKTNLKENSIDLIICFDMMHDVKKPELLLNEFYKVLKPNSILSFDDHHSKEEEIIPLITSNGLFKLVEKKENQYNFKKV